MKKDVNWQIIIPTALTGANLMIGFIVITGVDLISGMILLLIACVFDIFDGIIARWLKVSSEFGKELDSLADIIVFGVAPAVVVYNQLLPHNMMYIVLAGLLPLFSGIRLAVFNTRFSENYFFYGIPTPVNGLFFISLPWLSQNYLHLTTANIVVLMLLFLLLMISPIRMFSFKMMRHGGVNTILPIVFLITLIPMTILGGWLVIPGGVASYVFLSLIYHAVSQKDIK